MISGDVLRPARWFGELTSSGLFLIAVNLIPLFGVVFWGWNVGTLMLLYWMENVIYGAINVVKILTAGLDLKEPYLALQFVGRGFTTLFFLVHYGMFCFVHGIFVVIMFVAPELTDAGTRVGSPVALYKQLTIDTTLLWTLAGLMLSHIFSLVVNWFGKGEYKTSTVGERFGAPYGRIVILHLAILLGGFVTLALGGPVFALIILIALKTGFDLVAHARSHRSKENSGTEAG